MWLCSLEGVCFPFSLAGPGVAGYLTAGTSSSVMSNLPPPVDHEAGDLGYQTWNLRERHYTERPVGAQSTFLQLIRWSKLLLPSSWFHDSVIPFSMNIFLFRKSQWFQLYHTIRKHSVDQPKWVPKNFFLDVCKHILLLYICLQDCESKRQNLPSFYNVFFFFWISVTVRLNYSLQKLG